MAGALGATSGRKGRRSPPAPLPIIEPGVDRQGNAAERDRDEEPPERVEVGHERQHGSLRLRQHLLRHLDAGGADGGDAGSPAALQGAALGSAPRALVASRPRRRSRASGSARPSSAPARGRYARTRCAGKSRSPGSRLPAPPPRTEPNRCPSFPIPRRSSSQPLASALTATCCRCRARCAAVLQARSSRHCYPADLPRSVSLIATRRPTLRSTGSGAISTTAALSCCGSLPPGSRRSASGRLRLTQPKPRSGPERAAQTHQARPSP